MTKYPCEYRNESNQIQILTLDERERVLFPNKSFKFEVSSLDDAVCIKSLDGAITSIESDTIPCYKLVINHYMAA